jgi:hypothetical protein
MPDSDIIEKIKKVLALASNNPSAEEGQTAMLLAQKMMIENKISMVDIEKSGIQQKDVNSISGVEAPTLKWWEKQLGIIIAENFKCITYIYTQRIASVVNGKYVIKRTKTLKIVGLKDDAELTKQVLLYAIEVLKSSFKKYVRKNSDRLFKKGIKNQYIIGFLDGLKDKFAEQVKNNGWGLVLVKDPIVNKTIEDLKLEKGGKSTVITNGSESDRKNGYNDGRNFQYVAGN